MNPYREIFNRLNEAGIRYLIVGGVAVNLHGYRRFTGDVDILLALDEDNLDRMTELMNEMGYIERLPITLKDLNDPVRIQEFIDEKGMTAFTFQSNDELHIGIDILAGKSMSFTDFEEKKALLDLEDNLMVPVIGFDDLIAMKKEANRPEDLRDIEMLLHLKGL